MREEDIKNIYWTAYTDVLKFLKKYLMLMDCINNSVLHSDKKISSDEFWSALVDESSEIYKKHDCKQFVKNELVNATKEIERIYKEKEQ